jgi:hypothetical protein
MAEKSLVNEVALIDTVGAAAPELGLELLLGVLELDVPLLPHAATRRATPAAIEVRAVFLLRRFNETTFARERACINARRISGRQPKHGGRSPMT